MVNDPENVAEDQKRAEVFDALSHPTRILIIKTLNAKTLSFADLKRETGIESSGHLQHHLNKLGDLLKTDSYGEYMLSDQGKDALLSVETVEKVSAASAAGGNGKSRGNKSSTLKAAVVVLAVLLAASLVLAAFEYNQATTLQSQRDNAVAQLNTQLNVAANLQSLLAKEKKAVTQLDTALNFTQAVASMRKPQEGYLVTFPDGNQTKIFLTSTDAGYFYGPNPWPFTQELRDNLDIPTENGSIQLPDFGWSYTPGNYSYTFKGGNAYLTIGVTVRSDYTTADAENGSASNAAVGVFRDTYGSHVRLTVRLYGRNGSLIQADLYSPSSIGGMTMGEQEVNVEVGETAQTIFYVYSSSLDIDHYEVYVSSITAFTPMG